MHIRTMSMSELRDFIRDCVNNEVLAYALAVYEARQQMGE